MGEATLKSSDGVLSADFANRKAEATGEENDVVTFTVPASTPTRDAASIQFTAGVCSRVSTQDGGSVSHARCSTRLLTFCVRE